MSDYSLALGNAVKQAREKKNLTQSEVATAADIDVRTVLNIENYRGNPKLKVMYPLIRSLNLDSQAIFYPEINRESPSLVQLNQLLSECTEEELQTLLPVVTAILKTLRNKNAHSIK